jgi:hypothetical protein
MTAGQLIECLQKFNPEARIGIIEAWGWYELEKHNLYIQEPKNKTLIIEGSHEPRT